VRYRIHVDQVTHEAIDGEVVAVHLGTGCYYSLTGVAGELWQRLDAPHGKTELAASASVPAADAASFVDALAAEGLVVEAPDAPAPAPAEPTPARADYTAPSLRKFDDLQDLLILDPIHDVGDEGWPVAPQR
jgi:hypothetical protein